MFRCLLGSCAIRVAFSILSVLVHDLHAASACGADNVASLPAARAALLPPLRAARTRLAARTYRTTDHALHLSLLQLDRWRH